LKVTSWYQERLLLVFLRQVSRPLIAISLDGRTMAGARLVCISLQGAGTGVVKQELDSRALPFPKSLSAWCHGHALAMD
jgi:hypothetical protein